MCVTAALRCAEVHRDRAHGVPSTTSAWRALKNQLTSAGPPQPPAPWPAAHPPGRRAQTES